MESKDECYNKNINKFYKAAAIIQKESFISFNGKRVPIRPRIKELIEFFKKVNFRKIGIAFCFGLSKEASLLNKILKSYNFQVYSIHCKCGNFDKTKLGISKEDKINEFESACNPILQALLLNENDTELNIIVGLCIGHDLLFSMKSKAPVTTLIVKDKVTGHNPADYLEKLL